MTHFQEVVDYVMGEDNSVLAKTKAELAYALHSLEREIGLCQKAEARNSELIKALEDILGAEEDFREAMGPFWEGDLLSDACDAARQILGVPVGLNVKP